MINNNKNNYSFVKVYNKSYFDLSILMTQQNSESICCDRLVGTNSDDSDEQISKEFTFKFPSESIHIFEIINHENENGEKSFVKNDSEKQPSLLVSDNQFQIDDEFSYIKGVHKLDDFDLNNIVFDKSGTNKENIINLEEENKNNQYNEDEDDDIVYQKYYSYISSNSTFGLSGLNADT